MDYKRKIVQARNCKTEENDRAPAHADATALINSIAWPFSKCTAACFVRAIHDMQLRQFHGPKLKNKAAAEAFANQQHHCGLTTAIWQSHIPEQWALG